mgnify:CR=1 FL=1
MARLPGVGFVSGSEDATIRIWYSERAHLNVDAGASDVKTHNVVTQNKLESQILRGHCNEVTAIAVLENGIIASGSLDKSVRYWREDAGGSSLCCYYDTGPIGCLHTISTGQAEHAQRNGTNRHQIATGSNAVTMWETPL